MEGREMKPRPGLLEFTDPATGATWTYYESTLLDGTTITDTSDATFTITGGGHTTLIDPLWNNSQTFQYRANYDQGGYTTAQQEALERLKQETEKIQAGRDKFIKELQGVYIQAW